jgi:DNA-directed RNA polymerase specialized sigma24 family protein
MEGKDASFVQQLVATFSKTERTIIALHYVEDLTLHEIGLVLDLPTHQVEAILSAIRQRTREALATHAGRHAPISAIA